MGDASRERKPRTRDDFKVGFVYGEPAETYHRRRLDVASNGGLTLIDEKTPEHYRHWVETPDDEEESKALFLGKAYHCSVLEPEVFADTYIVIPDGAPADLRRFRDAKKPSQATLDSIAWWDDFDASNEGKILLPHEQRETMIAMATRQRAMVITVGAVELTLAELIDECQKEVSVYWIDEKHGIKCKARFDLLSEELRFAGDPKTALCASPEAFARAVAAHRYDQQQAHYSEGFRAITGDNLADFLFMPIEKPAPHVPAAYRIGPLSEQRGMDLRERALGKLGKCLAENRWPGYTSDAPSIEVPTWAFYGIDSTT